MPTAGSPNVTKVIDQNFFLAPLGGPQHPQNYLDRFPDEVYNKGIDSHLVKFMYALLGPAGAGQVRKNYLEARLKLEEFGMDTFELDQFYGNPLAFGRILEEVYDEDPQGLLPREQWEVVRAKNAAYRGRALDFVKGARAGNTPQGMKLVARSGLGHEVEIIENYKYLYDQLSDDPLGIPNYGKTSSTEEMIVLPRRDIPQSEVQTITILGETQGGTFDLFFPVANEVAASVKISWNAHANLGHNVPVGGSWDNVQAALEKLPFIGFGNVTVTGGPLPEAPIEVHFVKDLGYRDVPQLAYVNNLVGVGGSTPIILVQTTLTAVDPSEEIASIPPRDQRSLIEALGRIKPVTTIVTYGQAPGTRKTRAFDSVSASSQYTEVARFVTGRNGVQWPDSGWIEKSTEHQAPKLYDDLQHHYKGFHTIYGMASSSSHIGPFTPFQRALYPVLDDNRPVDYQFNPDKAPADYAEPLSVSVATDSQALVNGIYPTSYSNLPGVAELKYKDEQFWASKEAPDGTEYLEIDLGSVQSVNYLYMEATTKPFDLEIYYDILDMGDEREWRAVTHDDLLTTSRSIFYNARSLTPWQPLEYWFANARGKQIFTRFIRIVMTRRNDLNSPFTTFENRQPFSIDIRNLRIARNTV